MGIRRYLKNRNYSTIWFGSTNTNTSPTSPSIIITGGTPYTPGDGYEYFVFTTTGGSISIENTTLTADVLVVGGGGAGGENIGGGGGGGGAVVYEPQYVIVEGNYQLTVGAGGTGLVNPYTPYPLPGSPGDTAQPNINWRGYPGESSSIGSLIVAPGGGAAIAGYQPTGGGGGGGTGGSPGGGNGGNGPQPFRNGPGNPGSNGTLVSVFTGIGSISPNGYFGGGGGGGAWDGPNGPWPGGLGGGGPSGSGSPNSGTPGTINTGGGGGGVLDPTGGPTSPRKGGDGGPGVIILRYLL